MECVLSIVDHGSELQAIAATATGAVVGRATLAGSTNPRFIEPHLFRRRLQTIVSEASAGLDDAVCLAVATAIWAPPDLVREVLAELVPIDRERVLIAPLERCAIAGGVGGVNFRRAIVMRADLSSRGWGIDGHGREAICGGFGEVLGDEGSAYWIGQRGLRCALKAFEKRSRNTLLKTMAVDHYGFKSHLEIVGSEERASALDRDAIAGFAPFVFEAARSDDRVALEILDEGGRELAVIALALVNELDLIDSTFQVLPMGSVFRQRGPFQEVFVKTLKNKTAKATLIQEGMGPAAGGALLAIDHLGLKIRPAMVDALRMTIAPSA